MNGENHEETINKLIIKKIPDHFLLIYPLQVLGKKIDWDDFFKIQQIVHPNLQGDPDLVFFNKDLNNGFAFIGTDQADEVGMDRDDCKEQND